MNSFGFESNVSLIPSPEAYGCLMLSSSLEFNYRLIIDGVVINFGIIISLVRYLFLINIFIFSQIIPQVQGVNCEFKRRESSDSQHKTGLCFSAVSILFLRYYIILKP